MNFFKIFLSILIILLPAFEGGNSSTGLFVIHSLTVLGLSMLIYRAYLGKRRVKFPLSALMFVPFGVYLTVLSYFSAYQYSSFLVLTKFLAFLLILLLASNVLSDRRFFFRILTISASIQALLYLISHFSTINSPHIFTFLNPNRLALFLCISIAGSLYNLKREENLICIFTVLGAGISTFAVFLTESRTGILCLLVIFTYHLYVVTSRKKQIILYGLIVVIILFTLILISYDTSDPYRFDRVKVWSSSADIWLQNPILGCGPGIFEYLSKNHKFPTDTGTARYDKIFSNAHSGYLQLLTETGIVGILLLGLPLIFFVPELRDISPGTGLGIAVFLIGMFFDVIHLSTALSFTLAIVLGTAMNSDDFQTLKWIPEKPFLIIFVIVCSSYIFIIQPCMANLYFKRMDIPKYDTVKNYNRAVFFNPLQPYYHQKFGRMLSSKENISLERYFYISWLYDQAISLNPLESSFYRDKARILRKMRKRIKINFDDRIIQAYKKAIRRSEKSPFLYLEYATFNLVTGKHRKTSHLVNKTLKLEPNYLNALLLKAKLNYKTGKDKKARKLLERVKQRKQSVNPQKVKTDYEKQLFNLNFKQYLKLSKKIEHEQ